MVAPAPELAEALNKKGIPLLNSKIEIKATAKVRHIKAGELIKRQPLIKAELGPGVKLSDVVKALEKENNNE
jgi:hypothetical protein